MITYHYISPAHQISRFKFYPFNGAGDRTQDLTTGSLTLSHIPDPPISLSTDNPPSEIFMPQPSEFNDYSHGNAVCVGADSS